MSGRAKSVKHFERSNGLDTALYKNYLYLFLGYTQMCDVSRLINGPIIFLEQIYTRISVRLSLGVSWSHVSSINQFVNNNIRSFNHVYLVLLYSGVLIYNSTEAISFVTCVAWISRHSCI